MGEVERARSALDPWYFLTQHVWTIDADGQERRFPDWNFLKDFIWKIHHKRRVVCLKSRQMLVTWGEVGYATWLTGLHANLEALLISKNATDSREMVRRAHIIADRLAPELGMERLPGRARSQSVFRWANGSRIISLPCVSSAARNRSPAFVGLDEVAYQKDAKGIYHSVQGCMLPQGRLVAISTPNPRREGTFFRELCKDPARFDFERQDVWPHMHPAKDRAWAAAELRRLGETAFRHEHGLCLDAGGEGQLYAPFSVERHVEDDVEIPGSWRRYRTMDFGPNFACLWVAEGPPVGGGSLGNLVAYRELPLKGLPSSIRARLVKERSGNENYEFTMSDSADPQARLEMATEGVPSMPCPPKDLLESIWKVKRLFEGDGISSPRLTVSRACPNLIGQLQDLQQDEAGYPLAHQTDHLADPLMYLVKFLELRARGDATGTPDVQPEDRGEDRGDLYSEMGVGDVDQEPDEFDFDERELGL